MPRQPGHDATLTLNRYGHVIDELEEAPRLDAEAAIRAVRRESCTSSVPSSPAERRSSGRAERPK